MCAMPPRPNPDPQRKTFSPGRPPETPREIGIAQTAVRNHFAHRVELPRASRETRTADQRLHRQPMRAFPAADLPAVPDHGAAEELGAHRRGAGRHRHPEPSRLTLRVWNPIPGALNEELPVRNTPRTLGPGDLARAVA